MAHFVALWFDKLTMDVDGNYKIINRIQFHPEPTAGGEG
jgi:anthranilate/para-aminobenzoate synthase component II